VVYVLIWSLGGQVVYVLIWSLGGQATQAPDKSLHHPNSNKNINHLTTKAPDKSGWSSGLCSYLSLGGRVVYVLIWSLGGRVVYVLI
jgi:hypothetical protein